MFKKNLAVAIMGLFIPRAAHPIPAVNMGVDGLPEPMHKTKGQLRAAKGKPSGAAQLKRAAKKRNNIRKH